MALTTKDRGDGTVEVEVMLGVKLLCLVCGHDAFQRRGALLNSRAATFFNLDWVDQGATNFICTQCGYVHWFVDG